MNNSSFDVGARVRLRGQPYEICAAAKRSVVLKSAKTGEFEQKRKTELAEAYRKGDLTFDDLLASPNGIQVTEPLEKSMADYSQRSRDEVKAKLHYLHRLCPSGTVIVTRAQLREELVKCHAELPEALRTARPPGISTFYGWRKDWIKSGYRAPSMVNRYDLRGRPPQDVPVELLPFIEQAINETYATKNRATVVETVDHACGLVEKHNLLVAPIEALPRPTRRQVLREIRRRDRYTILAQRYGKAHALAATRIFRKKPEPERLLDRVEVDHTPLDLIVLTSTDGLAQRPYLTVLIDVASRMITGFLISFRTPNSATVLRALRTSILPKDDVLRTHKIKAEHPACGVPRELFLDNGKEFHSADLEGAALDLHMKLVYCPRRQPRFKGVVERWLKEINYGFMHLLPGTTFDRYFKRGDLDSVKDAVIPLDDLIRLIWKWITQVYNVSFHRGIQTCPLEKWEELLKMGKPALPKRADILTVYAAPIEKRTLTSKGIEINCQHYVCNELDDLFNRLDKSELTVRPDNDDLGRISVLHPERDTYFTAFSTMPEYANGLSVEQDQWIRALRLAKYASLPYERGVLLAKQELREEVRAMVKAKDDAGSEEASQQATKPKRATRPPRPRSEKQAQAVAEISRSVDEQQVLEPQPAPSQGMPLVDFGALKAFPTGQSSLF